MDKISYTAITNLYDAYFAAQYALNEQLANKQFNAAKRDILYNASHSKEFEDSLKENIVNNLNNKVGLKAYIEDVYYNKLMALLVRFKYLQSQRVAEIGQAAAVNDELFLIVANGYRAATARLTTVVKDLASTYEIVNLLPGSEITLQDYAMDGTYLYLKKHDDIAKPKATQPAVALYHYYLSKMDEGEAINSENVSRINNEYGWNSKNSDKELSDLFAKIVNHERDNINHLTLPENKKAATTTKVRMEWVIEKLNTPTTKRSYDRARDEFKIFNAQYQKEY